MTEVATRQDQYQAAFDASRPTRAGEPGWLARLREEAIARFAALGLPSTRDEEWRFTPIAPIADTTFRLPVETDGAAAAAAADRFRLDEPAAPRLVFVNGRFAPALSSLDGLPPGMRVASLASVLADAPGAVEPHLTRVADDPRRAFTALNTAFAADGAFISVPAHAVVETPVHVLFIADAPDAPVLTCPRLLLLAGEHSQVRVVESYASPAGRRYLTNAVTEVLVGPNAVVDHYRIQEESLEGFHIGSLYVRAARGGNFSSHSVSLGGALVRNEAVAVLAGEGAECTLNGLYVADGSRLVDNHTTIDHAMPHCDSHEIYKGILGGRARAVFNGKIIVRPDAQKTDAKQTNKALLLSDDAQINSKPQLEIFANDVKCTHGAAIGQLDEDAIFYLRARGLSFREARDLLIYAYAGDILNRIRIEALRAAVEARLSARLPAGMTGGGAS